jgi:phosphoribosyl 1,2-cyclic phosphodiesterase
VAGVRLAWYIDEMKLIALQSGSNGNCIYVQARGVRLLFDAGISGSQARQRLDGHGQEIARVDALLISHNHRDHASGMGIFQRKFGLPIHATRPTLDAAQASMRLGKLSQVHHFTAGSTLDFGGVRVETIPTPHDGVDGVAFVVDDGRSRLGILTDLGHRFDRLLQVMGTLDAVLLESNYDPAMLAGGSYPTFLKRRIAGRGGHLSNLEAAALLGSVPRGRLRWACLGHLSEQNNTPELALQTHRQVLGNHLPLVVASRYHATDVLEVS